MPHFSGPFVPITLGQQAAVKSVRNFHCLALLLFATLLWGCAAASVGLQGDGRYVLERGEQSADCQALHKNITGRIALVKTLPEKARAEQQAPAPTASSLFGRLFGGPTRGLNAVAQYDRERAHVYALQRTMVDKKCVDVDVDTELADVAVEMAKIRPN